MQSLRQDYGRSATVRDSSRPSEQPSACQRSAYEAPHTVSGHASTASRRRYASVAGSMSQGSGALMASGRSQSSLASQAGSEPDARRSARCSIGRIEVSVPGCAP